MMPERPGRPGPEHCHTLDDLQAMGLMEPAAVRAFESLTRLALRLFDVRAAMVSLVADADDRQYFASVRGLAEPWQSRREMPLSHSLCKVVRDTGAPLSLSDARTEPGFLDHPAIADLGVVGYLGVPVFGPGQEALGALCIVSDTVRPWTDREIALLCDIARCVTDEIALRARMVHDRGRTARLEQRFEVAQRSSALKESVMWAFMAPDLPMAERIPALLRATCRALDFDAGHIVQVREDCAETLYTDRGPSALAMPRRIPLAGSLASLVLRGGQILQLGDVADSPGRGRFDMNGSVPQSYVGVPILADERVFGLLELTADAPRKEAASDDALSVVTIVSMIASVCLGLIDQIRRLEQSEAQLLACLGTGTPGALLRKFA